MKLPQGTTAYDTLCPLTLAADMETLPQKKLQQVEKKGRNVRTDCHVSRIDRDKLAI